MSDLTPGEKTFLEYVRTLTNEEQEKLCQMMEYMQRIPGSSHLLEEARSKGYSLPSETFHYMLEHGGAS